MSIFAILAQTDVIKIRISRWGHPGSRYVLKSMLGFLKRDRKQKTDIEKVAMWTQRQRLEQSIQRPVSARGHQKLEEARKDSALDPLAGAQPS